VDTTLAGTHVAAGEKVVMWYAGANFDEAHFEDSMAFDVGRPKVPGHVAFGGGGAHFCLGASLARIELSVLVSEVLDRGLRLEPVGDPVLVSSNFVNGVESLKMTVVADG
jgi:cholest-4-en-3-one 26-monooxygenase